MTTSSNVLGVFAVLVGLSLGVSTSMVVVYGEATSTVVGNAMIFALILAAGLWLRHGAVVTAPRSGWLPKVFVVILAGGLLVASTTFFLAIGAALATLGALGYGVMLWARWSPRAIRGQGIVLIVTSIGVAVAATLGDLATERGFEFTGVLFSIGMGVSTALLATTPTREVLHP